MRRSGPRRVPVVLAVGLAALALVLSQVTNARLWLHSTGRWHDWYHLGLFAVLGLLAMRSSHLRSVRVCWVMVAVMLGFAIELGEAIRYEGVLEWGDVLLDATGVVAGALVGVIVSRDDGDAAE